MDEQIKIKKRIRVDRSTLVSTVQIVLLLYLVVWSISPPMDIDMVYRVVALACAALWFFLDLSAGLRLDRMQKLALVFLLLVIVIALIEYRGDFSKMMRPIAYYMLVLGFIINYSYRDRMGDLRILILVFVVLLIVYNYITIRALIVDSTIARRLVRADESIYPYLRQGVGGYTLVYSQVFLFPLLVAWTFNAARSKHFFQFILGVVWGVSFIFLILKAGYTIAIVTVAVSLMILLFYRKRSLIPAVLITFGAIMVFVLMIGYIDVFREFLLNTFEGTTVAKKVNDIYITLHGVETASSIVTRASRYNSSLETFFHYPVIGGLWWDSGGGHSALLEAFAKYGLWGGIMFVLMFFCVPIRIKETSENNVDIRIANALLISLTVVTLLDSMPYQMVFPVLLVAPVLFFDIQEWRKENEDQSALDSQPVAYPALPQTEYPIRESRRLGRVDGGRTDEE